MMNYRCLNTIDGETNVNATSVHLEVNIRNKKVLLCGDSPFEAIGENVENYDIIQLPHHGKPAIADKIFEATWESASKKRYIISDNTGTSGTFTYIRSSYIITHINLTSYQVVS